MHVENKYPCFLLPKEIVPVVDFLSSNLNSLIFLAIADNVPASYILTCRWK